MSCVESLKMRSDLDAKITAHVVDYQHHYRQKRVRTHGSLEAFFELDPKTSSNRQELPPSVAFNHSFWVIRASAVLAQAGEPPWPCMGKVVEPSITESGRSDVHNELDLLTTENWLRTHLSHDFFDRGV